MYVSYYVLCCILYVIFYLAGRGDVCIYYKVYIIHSVHIISCMLYLTLKVEGADATVAALL